MRKVTTVLYYNTQNLFLRRSYVTESVSVNKKGANKNNIFIIKRQVGKKPVKGP